MCNREFNTKVDNLSKDVLLLQEGTFIEQVFKGGTILPTSKCIWSLSCHLDSYETMNIFLGKDLEKLSCSNLEDHNTLEHKVCLETLKGLVSFFEDYLFGHKMYIWFQTLKYQYNDFFLRGKCANNINTYILMRKQVVLIEFQIEQMPKFPFYVKSNYS